MSSKSSSVLLILVLALLAVDGIIQEIRISNLEATLQSVKERQDTYLAVSYIISKSIQKVRTTNGWETVKP